MIKMRTAIKTLKQSNLLIAFVINISFLLLVILFCDIKYEVSDDFIVDAVLSGAYGGGYDEHLLFSNILYGYFLKFLYRLIPVVSWYFVCQMLICFLSLCAVTYIILEKNHRCLGIALSIVFISFFSDDLYILPQFTKTAAVAICAGGALFLFGIWSHSKKRWKSIAFGGGLAVIGTMIRFSNLYIAVVYLLLIFIKYAWEIRKENKCIIHILRAFLICAILAGSAYTLSGINGFKWMQQDSYSDYKSYNHIRASVTDVKGYGYRSIAEEIAELGYDETDYDMIDSWNFLDSEYFTDSDMKQISQIKKDYSASVNHSIKGVVRQFLNRRYETYVVAMGAAVLMLFLLFLEPKKFCWEIIEIGITALLLLYFFYRGRVVYRVEYSIFVCMAISLVTTFGVQQMEPSHKRILTYWSIVFCVCKLPLYVPDRSYQTMSAGEYTEYIEDVFYESWKFDIRKYRCNVNTRQPYGALTSYMEADAAGYYLIDFSSAIQLIYYNYKPWVRLPVGYWENYSYLGGVTTNYPGNNELWESKGIDAANPYRSLINDNIYVVDKLNDDVKLDYLKKRYYPNARKVLVDTIDSFQIWKFYKE